MEIASIAAIGAAKGVPTSFAPSPTISSTTPFVIVISPLLLVLSCTATNRRFDSSTPLGIVRFVLMTIGDDGKSSWPADSMGLQTSSGYCHASEPLMDDSEYAKTTS